MEELRRWKKKGLWSQVVRQFGPDDMPPRVKYPGQWLIESRRVERTYWRVMATTGEEFSDPVRVEEVQFWSKNFAAVAVVLAKVHGVALVWDYGLRGIVVGRLSCVTIYCGLIRELGVELKKVCKLWVWRKAMRDDHLVYSYALEALRLHDRELQVLGPSTAAALESGDKLRADLLRVQHRVVQEFPEFRIWRDGGRREGQEEIWLRRKAAGYYLGGSVWISDYYYSNQHFKDMGLLSPPG